MDLHRIPARDHRRGVPQRSLLGVLRTGSVREMSAVAANPRIKRRSPARIAARTLLYTTVIGLAVVFVAPLVWGFFNSLREMHQGVTGPVIPSPAHWDNFHQAWSAQIPYTFSHYL